VVGEVDVECWDLVFLLLFSNRCGCFVFACLENFIEAVLWVGGHFEFL